MISELSARPSVRVTGMLRIHDDIVNQLVGFTDVSPQLCPISCLCIVSKRLSAADALLG